MQEEDEVAITRSTSWNAEEGCLERSLGISKENDESETPGPTSRLVLVPPSGEYVPCELTVTFQRRLCRVRQIYVLSSARTVELYSQSEQDGECEYVSTIRGELVSLPEDEFSDKGAEDDRRSFSQSSENYCGEDGVSQSASSASSDESASKLTKEDDQNRIPLKVDTEKLVVEWKEQLFNSKGSSLGQSRDSEEESFQSLSDDGLGKMVDGSIIFDEPLDHTDWVECPHSPMKSSALSSDDEVDINKCGFFLVDSNGGKQAGQLGSSQLSTGVKEAAVNERDDASEFSGWSKSRQGLPHGQSAQEQSELPAEPSVQVVNESAIQSDDVSELRDARDARSPRKHSGTRHHSDPEASRNACSSNFIEITGEKKEAFLFQMPMYEAEMNLAGTDAWRSVKMRLLSLEDKSKLELYKVIITLDPGPIVPPTPKTSGSFGSFQQGAGSSSLLAMLAPGIFQMARGLTDSRKVNYLGFMSGENKLAESKVSPSDDSTKGSLSVLGAELPSQQLTPFGTTSSAFVGSVSQRKSDSSLGEEKAAANYLNVRKASQDEPCSTGIGLSKEPCFPVVPSEEAAVEFDQSDGIERNDVKNVHNEKFEEFVYCKDDGGSHEVVQRLDRLEAICLRMENSLNFALENMEKRLKLLEAGGLGRMPVSGQPFWGGGYESVTSVNLPPVQTGIRTGSALDKQTHACTSVPVDSPAGQLSTKGVASRIAPVYPGLLSSTSPSLLSSVSPAPPLWPLSSPKHVSPESNSCASSTTTSTLSKGSHVDQLNGSCHGQAAPISVEETYWETQTSDDSRSDMSSDSGHTSYADNSEDPGPSSCPESVSSSPAKPAELVENALASALSAFSASFDSAVVEEKDSFQREEEDTAEDDSFTSEEQAPLVDIDCFSLPVEEETTRAKAEDIFMEGYEAIPISVEKELCDLNVSELRQDDVFWASEVEGPDKASQIDWQDEMLQTQAEKVFFAQEDSVEGVGKVSGAAPDLLLDTSNVLRMDDLTTYDLFPTDFERILRADSRMEPVGGERSEAVSQAVDHGMLPNAFLQELTFDGDEDVLAPEASWLEDWNEKQLGSGDNVTVTYMSVRGFTKPLDPHKEMLLQEEMFPEDWNWFTSEVPPPLCVRDLPENLSGNESLKPEAISVTFVDRSKGEDDDHELSTGYKEPRSLLDEDVAVMGGNGCAQFRVDVYSKDWVGQKIQWSLLDDDPPLASSEEFRSEEGCADDWLRQREQRSLLDEDIFIPFRDISTGEGEGSIMSPCASPEEQYNLSGVIRPQKCTDTVRSPSCRTSRSNPFEDDCNKKLDVKQGNQNPQARGLRNLLEDFGEEVHEFEAPESERTQSLLFHLSL